MDICSHIRLSVIVPVFNAEQYLCKCLEAITAVKCKDIEVFLVDDGSTDTSKSICDEYSKRDVRFHVLHKQNGGVSSARNLGLEKANGEWVAFVDADDIPTESFLVYKPSLNSDLICYNWQYTTGDAENERLEEGLYQGEKKKKFLNQHLVDFIFRTPWAKWFRRSVIKDNNIWFDERFRLGEDNLFMLDYLIYCGTIKTKSDLGYVYLRPSQAKYNLPLSYSLSFITVFVQKYKLLAVDCKSLLLLLEYYYFMKVGDDSLKAKIRWERCWAVREIQNVCWKNYSLKEKIKILLRRTWGDIIYGKD